MKRILITGALGQLGTELTMKCREIYGEDHVIATDIRQPKDEKLSNGPFEILDVMDGNKFLEYAKKYRVDCIIHLAALLSVTAENHPLKAWKLNMDGLLNALETSRLVMAQFFTPSSIGAFGPSTPKNNTPQVTLQRPTTMYGINKVAGELLADYYFHKYGVDTRGLRFPGLISYLTPPGGGTTDYAIEIYEEALKNGRYTCYLEKGTSLDMMYMPDALTAILDLMEADASKLKHRNAYNVKAMSVTPEDFAKEIQKHLPHFVMDYKVDPVRQEIADSWPNSIDATAAKSEWGFKPVYDIEKMTIDMLEKLTKQK